MQQYEQESVTDFQPNTSAIDKPQIRSLEQGVGFVLPDINSNLSLAAVVDPERTAHRQSLDDAAREVHSTIPVDPLKQSVYLAATGTELRALYDDKSYNRISKAQWTVIEKLAKVDMRFKAEHPEYNDGLRSSVHDRIAAEYPEVKPILDDIDLAIPEKDELPAKDDILEGLYSQFPYFNDVLEEATAAYNLDERTRVTLELLYTENRIATMHSALSHVVSRAVPHQTLPLFERKFVSKYADTVTTDGAKNEGRISRALQSWEVLSENVKALESTTDNLERIEQDVSVDLTNQSIDIFPAPTAVASFQLTSGV